MGVVHTESHPLAGQEVTIARGPLAGKLYRVEDRWDRVTGERWRDMPRNPAAAIYADRVRDQTDTDLPIDDEVVYGKIEHLGHLVHVTELEAQSEIGDETLEFAKGKLPLHVTGLVSMLHGRMHEGPLSSQLVHGSILLLTELLAISEVVTEELADLAVKLNASNRRLDKIASLLLRQLITEEAKEEAKEATKR